jgi:hypothetical protein
MRKRLLAILSILVVAGLAFGAGLVTQRYHQLIVIAESVDVIVGSAEQPPELESFAFPNSELRSKSSSGGVSNQQRKIIHNPQVGMWTTADSFEDVLVHYARSMGFEQETNIEKRQSVTNAVSFLDIGGADASSKALIRDNSKLEFSGYPPPMRLVRVECLIKRTRTYHVNVILSRADDDELTHIIVLFDPLF